MGYRVVVAGATGNVGREMLNILAEREFPADEIAVLASARSRRVRSIPSSTGTHKLASTRANASRCVAAHAYSPWVATYTS